MEPVKLGVENKGIEWLEEPRIWREWGTNNGARLRIRDGGYVTFFKVGGGARGWY